MIKLCTLLAFLLTLGMVLCTVGDWYWQRQETRRQMERLDSMVAGLGEAERTHQRNLAKWYNYNLEQGTPGLWAAYDGILNLGDGMMGMLEVRSLGLRLPICRSGGGTVCHDPATPLPIGGRGLHTVLYLSDFHFWQEGQTVFIDCLGLRLNYRVESVQVMGADWTVERPTEAGQDLLTLVYDRGNTRILVRCVRCEELVLREGKGSDCQWVVLAALPLILMIPALRRIKWFALRKIKSPKEWILPPKTA
jgi:hypothetical protein